ncbi:MAG TPA: LPS export ABC transporter periplasmic protein LptC [Puia sp.]|nr:LPS export ABC transporter periplasmic protein LptC [Puia sp.]
MSTINKFLSILLMGCIFCSSCENNMKDLPSSGKGHVMPPEEVWQVESLLSEGGKIKGKLTAPYMKRYQRADTPYAEFPRSLHVDFFKDSVKNKDSIVIESQMDALYGKWLPNQNKVYLRDTVVVKNILKGDTVHCQELWWDQHTEKFYTDKPVRIYQKDKILFGVGMEADQNFRWYTIKKLTGIVLTSEKAMK